MRLDHHCPWINNCVGFSNHKYFLQCLIYALASCVFALATASPYLYETSKRFQLIIRGVQGSSKLEPTDEIAFLVFGVLALFISVFLVPLLVIQMRLAVVNRTTIEDNYDNIPNPFNQGYCGNIAQIFGHLGLDWLFPIEPWKPFLDGVSFPNSHERFPGDPRLLGQGSPRGGWDSSTNYSEDSFSAGRMLGRAMGRGQGANSGYADGPMGMEERWRIHYNIVDHIPLDMMNKPRHLSTLDYMMGCNPPSPCT